MATHDHRCRHAATVIVVGLIAADPAPSLAESAAAIAAAAGSHLDVSVETHTSASRPRELFIFITGHDAAAAATAILAAPHRSGLARAALTYDLTESDQA